MIDRVAGIMNAAPIPCTARNAIRNVSFGAKPITALEMPNTMTPNRNIRRRPKMSPNRPPVTSSTANVNVYALTVHSSEDRVAWRSRWIEGRATFTTVLSSMIMNSAKHIAPRVIRLRSEHSLCQGGSDPFGSADGNVVAAEQHLEGVSERPALVIVQSLCELLQAVEPGSVELADHVPAAFGDAHALHPPVVRVLVTPDEAAPDEIVDRPAGGRQRQRDPLGQFLQGERTRGVLELVHDLDLGHAELEHPQRFEQVRR